MMNDPLPERFAPFAPFIPCGRPPECLPSPITVMKVALV
jgi:hypothetical protein